MLKIADQIFEIEHFSFCQSLTIGQNGWHVSWCLGCEAKAKEVEKLTWAPSVRSHYFSSLVQNPEELHNLKIALPDRDPEDNEPMFLLYVFEHEAIRNVELSFGEWKNNEINVSFKGISNVYASEIYGSNLPINFEFNWKYTGIYVDEGEEAWAVKKFSQFFNPDNFFPPESLGKASGFMFRPRNQKT